MAYMQNVPESLAGRIGILELQGLSLREKHGIQFYEPFVSDDGYVTRRAAFCVPYGDIWQDIHRGVMPEMSREDTDWDFFYRSYTKSYLHTATGFYTGRVNSVPVRQKAPACRKRPGSSLGVRVEARATAGISLWRRLERLCPVRRKATPSGASRPGYDHLSAVVLQVSRVTGPSAVTARRRLLCRARR